MTRKYKFLSDNELISVAPAFEYGGRIVGRTHNPYRYNPDLIYAIHDPKVDLRLTFGYNYTTNRIKKRAITKLLDNSHLERVSEITVDGEIIKSTSFRDKFIVPTKSGLELWDKEKSRFFGLMQKQQKRQSKLGVGNKCIVSAYGYVNGIHMDNIYHGIVGEYVYVESDWSKKSAVRLLHYIDPNMKEYAGDTGDSRMGEIIWAKHHTGNSRFVNPNMITVSEPEVTLIEQIRHQSTITNRILADSRTIHHYHNVSRRTYYAQLELELKKEITELNKKINDINNRAGRVDSHTRMTIKDFHRNMNDSYIT